MLFSPDWTDGSGLMSSRANKRAATLLLRFRERGRYFLKHCKVLVDIRFGMLHGDRPLFVPPIRLREHAAIDHREPVVAPEIDIDLGPVAVVLNLLGIEHQRAVDSGSNDVGLQAGFL